MDDEVFKICVTAFGSWKNWAVSFYQTNSGRVLIHTLVWAFMNMPITIWVSISALFVVMTIILCQRYTSFDDDRCNALLLFFSAILFFMIPGQNSKVFGGVATSLNYLFPVCAMLLELNVFYLIINGKYLSTPIKIIAVPVMALCSNMEQSGAVMFAMGIIYLGYGFIFRKSPEKKIVDT